MAQPPSNIRGWRCLWHRSERIFSGRLALGFGCRLAPLAVRGPTRNARRPCDATCVFKQERNDMNVKTRVSAIVAVAIGVTAGGLGLGRLLPASHTVLAASVATADTPRFARTPGGRNITLMPVSGVAAAARTVAAAQMATGKKPNILMIMGDDIGWFNPSAYNRGMLGFETPNIDRIGKEGGIFIVVVRPAELHRWTRRVHYGAVTDPYRPHESRYAGRRRWLATPGSHHRGAAQAAGLCDGSVRQEPSRRSRRDAPDEPRIRRVLR